MKPTIFFILIVLILSSCGTICQAILGTHHKYYRNLDKQIACVLVEIDSLEAHSDLYSSLLDKFQDTIDFRKDILGIPPSGLSENYYKIEISRVVLFNNIKDKAILHQLHFGENEVYDKVYEAVKEHDGWHFYGSIENYFKFNNTQKISELNMDSVIVRDYISVFKYMDMTQENCIINDEFFKKSKLVPVDFFGNLEQTKKWHRERLQRAKLKMKLEKEQRKK